ncbi:MAG: hypothetical protein U0Q19_04620 [Kineosporiaceae bacterium]
MNTELRRRLTAAVTIVIFVIILKSVWDKVNLVIWTNVPWWGLILLLVIAYFVIEAAVKRLLGPRRR